MPEFQVLAHAGYATKISIEIFKRINFAYLMLGSKVG